MEGNQIDNPAYNPLANVQLLDECPYIGLKTVSTTSVPVFFDFRSMWDRHAVMPMLDLRAGVSFGEVFGKILYDPGIVTDVPPALTAFSSRSGCGWRWNSDHGSITIRQKL